MEKWSKTALAIAVTLGVVFTCFSPERPIKLTSPAAILGDTTYNMETVVAPILSGPALRAFSYLGTRTKFGPFLRRFLLLDNQVTTLRDLAAQMPDVQPLHHPVYRMGRKEREEHDKGLEGKGDLNKLIPFVDGDLVEKFSDATVLKLYRAFSDRSLSPVDVANKVLSSIEALNVKYRPFSVEPNVAEILKSAADSESRYLDEKPLSIFDGVPVAFKDMINIKGYVMTDGSSYKSSSSVAEEDDLIVKRFRDLGAIILPPTTMTEGGVTPIGYSVHPKGPFNPYDSGHYSGGSSGGSAVAVALGITPIAIGYDGGGSVRTPAALSGVYGIATGYGRIPFSSHLASTMIKSGVFGETVSDTILGYAVMARDLDVETDFFSKMYDGGVNGVPKAHMGALLRDETSTTDLSDVTIGVWDEWLEDSSPAVVKENKRVLDGLIKRGAKVKNFKIPNIKWARLSHALKISNEFASAWDGAFHDPNSNLEPNTRITVGVGSVLTALEIHSAEKIRAYIFEHVRTIFKEGGIDVIFTPTVPLTAPPLTPGSLDTGESNTPLTVELCKYIFIGNFLGLPGLANPIGFDEGNDGMPISALVTGFQWEEDKVFRVSAAIESSEGARKRPADAVSLLVK